MSRQRIKGGSVQVIIHPTDTCKFRLELSEEQAETPKTKAWFRTEQSQDKVFHFVALSRLGGRKRAVSMQGLAR